MNKIITAACTSKCGIVWDFSLIEARRDFDNEKLEIYFLESYKKIVFICYSAISFWRGVTKYIKFNSIIKWFWNSNYRGIFISDINCMTSFQNYTCFKAFSSQRKSTLKLNSSVYEKYEHGHLGRWYIKLTLFKRF